MAELSYNMSFKKAKLLDGQSYKKVVDVYEWNQNTAEFEKVQKDIQKEIDIYKNCDLKTMIEKNIFPVNNEPAEYADLTFYKDVDFHKMQDMLKTELIVENDEKNKTVNNENIVKDTNSNTESNKSNDEPGN